MGLNRRIAIAALFVLLGFFVVFYAFVLFDPAKKRADVLLPNNPAGATIASPTVTFVDPKRGGQDAKISIVEFSDYGCAYCNQVETTLNAALRRYPDLQLVWKDLPNQTTHKEALPAALAARCAGRQDKFWEYHDALFANQEWLNQDLYPKIATDLGLNLAKFQACVTNGDETPIIQRNVDEAIALGVDGTPYFFIGETRISGQIKPAELVAILDRLEATLNRK